MIWIITASIIWGFSFGLIKGLTAGIDPYVLGMIRSSLAAVFFLPWFLWHRRAGERPIPISTCFKAALCGSIQIGLMYGPYLLSFKYLKGFEVALFTMTTPIILSLMNGFKHPRHIVQALFAAAIATVGGTIVAWKNLESADLLTGVCLVQLSNILFAAGLLLWRHFFMMDIAPQHRNSSRALSHLADSESLTRQAAIMFPYFCGAIATSSALALSLGQPSRAFTPQDLWVFSYLGIIASGFGFYIWNRGALFVSENTLAVANNLKLPLAILISLAIFGETANYKNLFIGTTLLLIALKVARYREEGTLKTTQADA